MRIAQLQERIAFQEYGDLSISSVAGVHAIGIVAHPREILHHIENCPTPKYGTIPDFVMLAPSNLHCDLPSKSVVLPVAL